MTVNNVIPFPIQPGALPPPPAPRPMLQPSIYGRGIRNFVFSGPIDEWHAPGAIVSRQDTKCAIDAAWLVERVMGAPKRHPQVGFPGVRAARERALAWGPQAGPGLAPFQCEGAAFLAERDYALLVDEMGIGKAQPLDAKVLTPTGWRRMGDLTTGNEIINSAGTISHVTAVHPRGVRDVFRVTFQDGASTECCDEHLWAVETATRRFTARGARVLPLSEIRKQLVYTNGNRCHFIPVVAPISAFRPKSEALLVAPYLLGYLLGDGGLSGHSVRLTTADQESIERLAPLLPHDVQLRRDKASGPYEWAIASARAGKANSIIRALRHYGLMGKYSHNKFVPDVYKGASLEDRLAVLQGLLDTDGYVSPGNSIEYCTVSPHLCDDVVFLVRSLGGVARVKEKVTTHRLAYRMSIALPPDVVPFLLRRKAAVHRPRTKYLPHRAIVSVEPVGKKKVQCIAVDSADHLYITDDFILTHNTGQALVAAEARLSLAAIPEPNMPVALILCPALAKRHWQQQIKFWINQESTILEGRRPDPEQLKTRYIIANYDILFGGRAKDAAGVLHDVSALPGWGALLAGKFLIVINDEAHILKGRTAQKTKSVKALCRGVPVVWGLTGTPMPNYVRDLWSLVDVISDGLFGYSYWTWAETYCAAAKGQYGMVDTGSSHLEELQGRLAFFMLGRTAKGVQLELPEKRREVYRVDVEMTAPTVHEGNEALSKGMAVASALRKTAFAKRSAVVGAAVEALQAKQKVVVFVYMREQAEAVAKDIKKHVDCTVHAVSGDVSPSGRYEQAQTFREAQSPSCFVATIDAMGVALSLVGANLMIFGDVVPEPWKLLQAEKRGHRFDSPCRLLVRYVIATGTIDEGIVESVIAKIPVIERTLGQQDDASELTTMFGGRSSEEIVDSLFAKLKEWKAADYE